jgi:palmitoyltransferase
MVIWSFFQTMTTDPGQVPVFWGFHLGDNENKRKRYCLMCNVFKPERCHHCSACNRCVLNMDHHCPWINNCVGFWNRKYFLLLLIYVLIITYTTFFFAMKDFIDTVKFGYQYKAFTKDDPILKNHIIILFAYFFNFGVAFLMTGFLRFHLNLASDNKTTIENLDK